MKHMKAKVKNHGPRTLDDLTIGTGIRRIDPRDWTAFVFQALRPVCVTSSCCPCLPKTPMPPSPA